MPATMVEHAASVLAPRVSGTASAPLPRETGRADGGTVSTNRVHAESSPRGMGDRSNEITKTKAAIAPLAERVLAVDIRAYESMPPERVAGDLSPIVSELLQSATGLVSDVLRSYDELGQDVERRGESTLAPPHVPFEQAIDAAIDLQATSSLQAVGDIAFLAHLELRQRSERLHRVTTHGKAVAIVEECDSALRRIRKALTSIDVALARAGFGEAKLDFSSELDVSLRVRRVCAKLRSRVLSGGDPTPETLYARLRSAGTAIAMLVGWEVYPCLRVRDRLQLRDIQRRILDWLRHDKDPTAGLRLWQDLVSFMRMLSQVNRRQELVAHDRSVVREALARVKNSEGASLSEDTLTLLASLEGLDEEIDQLLISKNREERKAWLAPIERMAIALSVSEGEK